MMGHSQPPEYDKKELELAQTLWGKFTSISKWSVIGIVVILALMALFLV